MIAFFQDRIIHRRLKRMGIKCALSVSQLPARTELVMERGVSLGQVQVGCRELQIGAMTYIRSSSELLNVSRIGRFCSVGNGVVIGQDKSAHPLDWVSSHPFQFCRDSSMRYEPTEPPVRMGHDVWLGREAMILEGLNIGTGAVVAARALVTHDVPPYAIVAGIPARVIRYRYSPELIEALLSSRWWELPIDVLQGLPMNVPLDFVRQLQAPATNINPCRFEGVKLTRNGMQRLDEAVDWA